jgi:hypothetical protein
MNDDAWWAARRSAAEFWHKIKNTHTAPKREAPTEPRRIE